MAFMHIGGATTNVVQIYSPDDLWNPWNRSYTTTTTTTNGIIWSGWNSPSFDQTGGTVWATWNTMPTRTWSGYAGEIAREELRALNEMPSSRSEVEWAAIRAEQERAREQRDRLNAAARAQAHELLAMILTPDQIASYEARRYFEVVGSAGGRYRIHHGTSGNICRVVDGQEINRLCVHPRLYLGDHQYLPTEDCLAAQALALMHDEMGAVATANVHAGPRHLAAVA